MFFFKKLLYHYNSLHLVEDGEKLLYLRTARCRWPWVTCKKKSIVNHRQAKKQVMVERRLRPRRDAKGECGDVVGMHHPRNKKQLEIHKNSIVPLPETNIFAPENGWLEYYFCIGKAYFQGRLLLVSGRVGLIGNSSSFFHHFKGPAVRFLWV